MLKPFHLSFSASNMEVTKHFYQDVLGCGIGRERSTWMDLDFFGHQITIRQAGDESHTIYPMDHFGTILDRVEWIALVDVLKEKDVEFFMEPSFSKLGEKDEKAKFMIKDPDENVLEFKYYMDFDKTMNREKSEKGDRFI